MGYQWQWALLYQPPGNDTPAKHILNANKAPRKILNAIRISQLRLFKVHISTIDTHLPLLKILHPIFFGFQFSNFVFRGLFNGVTDDSEAQFQAIAFLFVAFRPASRGSQFRHRPICPCPCLKLSASSQVSGQLLLSKTVISNFKLKKMILGRALCGIKFLGAKLKQSHLEKTWLGWLVVPHPKKKCFVICLSPLCHSPGANPVQQSAVQVRSATT